MQVICAWCKKVINNTEIEKAFDEVSHGICKDCADKTISELGIPSHFFLDNLDRPILILDSENNVKSGNYLAETLLSKKIFVKSKAGDLLECKNALLPGGCGNTPGCRGCRIKKSITYTYQTGRSLNNVSEVVEKSNNGEINKFLVIFSTEKSGDYVIFRIKNEN